MTAAPAIFYDGLTARRHAVTVAIDDRGLTVSEGDAVLAEWPYDTLRQQDAPAGYLRLSAEDTSELARLEIADAALAADILNRCPQIHKATRARRTATFQIVGWSMAAAVSLVLTAIYLVPLAAERLTPLVPASAERWLGAAVDSQVRLVFGGTACNTPTGDASLAILRERLSDAAGLPEPVTITVLRSTMPNALTLPGGRIYVLSALLDKAAGSEEVVGVLAHEIGHAVHRDGLRRVLQSGGSSFLIGLLFGDVLGGGAIVIAARTLVDSAHSRTAETAADSFAAEILVKLGQSPKALGEFLSRLDGGKDNAFALLRSHPLSDERMSALTRIEPAAKGKPLLSDAQWQALKTICATPEE